MADIHRVPLTNHNKQGLQDLEQQLDLAEVRCGTLRGQVDYMKTLYSPRRTPRGRICSPRSPRTPRDSSERRSQSADSVKLQLQAFRVGLASQPGPFGLEGPSLAPPPPPPAPNPISNILNGPWPPPSPLLRDTKKHVESLLRLGHSSSPSPRPAPRPAPLASLLQQWGGAPALTGLSLGSSTGPSLGPNMSTSFSPSLAQSLPSSLRASFAPTTLGLSPKEPCLRLSPPVEDSSSQPLYSRSTQTPAASLLEGTHRKPSPRPAAPAAPAAPGPPGSGSWPVPRTEHQQQVPCPRPLPQVASVRPLSPTPTSAQDDPGANSSLTSSTDLQTEEPWQQVLGLVHGLAEDVRRMASEHDEQQQQQQQQHFEDWEAASSCSSSSVDRGGLSDQGASSGVSVYEDPLLDTPRPELRLGPRLEPKLEPRLEPRLEPQLLLREDLDIEIFSNDNFHSDSQDDSMDSDEVAADSRQVRPGPATITTCTTLPAVVASETCLNLSRCCPIMHFEAIADLSGSELPRLPINLTGAPGSVDKEDDVLQDLQQRLQRDQAAGRPGEQRPRSPRCPNTPRPQPGTRSSRAQRAGGIVREIGTDTPVATAQTSHGTPYEDASRRISRPWTAGSEGSHTSERLPGRQGHPPPPPAPPPSEMTASSACDTSLPPVPRRPQTESKSAAPELLRTTPHYERPTTASRLKRRSSPSAEQVVVTRRPGGVDQVANPRAVRRDASCFPRHKPFPFVAATSTSPSHNLQLSLQSVLSQRKMRRTATSPTPCPAGCLPSPTPRPASRAAPGPAPGPTPCPLLNASLSEEGGDSTSSNADPDAESVQDHGEERLSAEVPQVRWDAEGRRAGSGVGARCQCYPRHVAEYDRVLKPFLRRTGVAPQDSDRGTPRGTPPPHRSAHPQAAATTPPQVATSTASEQQLADLRRVLVALRRELVSLGEARDRERRRGRGQRRVQELEAALERKEAEIRVIVNLCNQVQLLRGEMCSLKHCEKDKKIQASNINAVSRKPIDRCSRSTNKK